MKCEMKFILVEVIRMFIKILLFLFPLLHPSQVYRAWKQYKGKGRVAIVVIETVAKDIACKGYCHFANNATKSLIPILILNIDYDILIVAQVHVTTEI